MEARAITGKRARAIRFLRAAARHVLIDLFLAELVVAGFLIGRLPVPVRDGFCDAHHHGNRRRLAFAESDA